VKQWTKSHPLDAETTRADEHAEELRSLKAQAAALDRTQLADGAIGKAHITANAMHKAWVFEGDDFNEIYPGEQSVCRDDTILVNYHFASATNENYTGGWQTVATLVLDGSKEGVGHVEFLGNFQNNIWYNDDDTGNPKRLAVRIRVDGQNVAETFGFVEAMGSFKIVGTCTLVAGDNTLTIEVKRTRLKKAEDDRVGVAPDFFYPQFHLFGCKVLAIGRWR
jgi:hypothetical protein